MAPASPDPAGCSGGCCAARPRVVLSGDAAMHDLPGLCHGLRRLTSLCLADADCDVAALVAPDLATVDLLARLALCLRAPGRRLHLVNTPAALARLLQLTGLEGALLGAGLQPGRQPEQREPARGVQEGVHRADPTA